MRIELIKQDGKTVPAADLAKGDVFTVSVVDVKIDQHDRPYVITLVMED